LRDDGGEDVLLGFASGDHFLDHEIDLAPMCLSAMLASLVCDTGIRV
jgi:hypothetical protein